MIELGDRWRVVSMLGAGGMGSVYLAHDSRLGELVALKMINPDLAANPAMIERFRDEVRLSRSVSSPFVARTHDLGEHEGRFFLTMEYVEGETLSARLKREGALPLADVVRIAHDVCEGLDAVHAAGIVHRDLKPGNVLLAVKDGRAVLTDFGIARRTSIAERSDGSGTPTYAAPEQLAGRMVDARADVYALGAMLYVMATGKKPFEGPRTGREAPPDARERAPQVPEAFASVIMRAMALDPKLRPETARAVYDAIAPLAKFGERAESRLFDFVRSIAGVSRSVAIVLRGDGVSDAVRDAVMHHLASRLGESGEIHAISDPAAAEAVLEGSVVLQDGKYTLPLALRSREGDVFWRASDDASASLPTLTDAVARSVARALSTSCIEDRVVIASPEASELFMQARSEYRQFYRPQLEHAVELLERVDQLEPNNPTIVAWHAAALARIRFFDDAPERASELARRAIELGAKDAVPYLALAEASLQDMRVGDAARGFITGLRIAPGAMDARVSLAHFLTEVGAFEPALRLAESLRAADPTFPGTIDVPMRIAAIHGRFDEVRRIHDSLPGSSGAHVRVRISALRYAIWNRDRAMFETAVAQTHPERFDGPTRFIFQSFKTAFLEGRSPPIDLVSASLGPRRRSLVYQFMCELSSFVREDRQFFEALDRAVATGLFDAPWIDACPLFDPYRGSLHFETARRTIHHRAYEALVEMDRCLGEPS